jgi:hypothetical protein
MTIILEQWTMIPSFSSNHPWSESLNKEIPPSPALIQRRCRRAWFELGVPAHNCTLVATWVHSDGGWRCVQNGYGCHCGCRHLECKCKLFVRSMPVIAGESSSAWSLELGLVCCCWYPQIKIRTRVSLTV